MNSLRCRVGDLCVVIRAVHPSNLGHIVRVLAPYDPRGCDVDMADADWLVESARPMTWSRGERHLWQRRRGPVPDECLQPLRGEVSPPMGSFTTACMERFQSKAQAMQGDAE